MVFFSPGPYRRGFLVDHRGYAARQVLVRHLLDVIRAFLLVRPGQEISLESGRAGGGLWCPESGIVGL